MGPNYLRFGLSLNTDLQGDTAFALLVGHKRVWVNSLGAEWINEIELGARDRYATEFYQPLTLGNNVFASAYGLSAARPASTSSTGSQRVAEYAC